MAIFVAQSVFVTVRYADHDVCAAPGPEHCVLFWHNDPWGLLLCLTCKQATYE